MATRVSIWILAVAALACAGKSTSDANASSPATQRMPAVEGDSVSAGATTSTEDGVQRWTNDETSAPEASAAAALHEQPEPCGALDCLRFGTARDAFRHVLRSDPLVVGIGEAHALKDAPPVASSARRFADELLPELAGRSSHLIVELLNPNPACQEATREVEQAQKPVTSAQSGDNQNDYVALGHRARGLGIEPFVLSPTCEELSAIAQAGAGAIDRTLATIADVTARMVLAALTKNARAGREQIAVAYGGALHNDESPRADRLSWSYGPRLARATGDRYVALDLIVREFIKDSDAWRTLPWYEHFDPERDPASAILMRTGAHSYVLFFPKSRTDVSSER